MGTCLQEPAGIGQTPPSPTDATWFFNHAKRGDVVNIIHATVGPKLSDQGCRTGTSRSPPGPTNWLQSLIRSVPALIASASRGSAQTSSDLSLRPYLEVNRPLIQIPPRDASPPTGSHPLMPLVADVPVTEMESCR